MPVTNRGSVPLRATDTTAASRDYLRAQPPTWTNFEASLAVFALFAVLCICAKRIYSWAQPSDRSESSTSTAPPALTKNGAHLTDPAGDCCLDEKNRNGGIMSGIKGGSHVSFMDDNGPASTRKLAIDPQWGKVSDSTSRPVMTRPPPAPPLTPPELSTTVFTFEGRPRSQESFIHQPNPDYMSSTTSSTSQTSSASPSAPRRRSYNRTIPIGVPVSQNSSVSEPDSIDLTFSPSSYPPTSPLLPPPPPGLQELETDPKATREIEVQGEIISVLDSEGAGWTRHTRVYGGGVCLACAASGGNHGGGFYGATVRPEEMHS